MKFWQIVLVTLAAFAAGLWLGKGSFRRAASEPKVRFYQDSMHPWVKSDQPGLCPVCRMKLTPILEGGAAFTNSNPVITLSPEKVTVAGVAAEPAIRRDIRCTIRVSGVFEAQESRRAVVAAPAAGRLESVSADHPGIEIRQGEPMARLFSPDLVQRSRYLRVAMSNQPSASVPSSGPSGATSRIAASPAGTANETSSPSPTVSGYRLDLFTSDLPAPISGIVVERPASVGQYVMEGQEIATIIDPSVLWFRFDVFSRHLPWISPDQQIEVRTESAPSKSWTGRVTFIEPVSNEPAGFARVRAAVTNIATELNPGAHYFLRPGMFAEGRVTVVLKAVLAVPKSAVVYPGSSAWVYVEHPAQSYERRSIRLGREGDDYWELLSGLDEGERVVTAGNVLVDSQATLENGSEESLSPAEMEEVPESVNAVIGGAQDSTHPMRQEVTNEIAGEPDR